MILHPLHDLGRRGPTRTNGLTQRLNGHVAAHPKRNLKLLMVVPRGSWPSTVLSAPAPATHGGWLATRRRAFRKTADDVLMEHARDQSLIRNAFLECPDLNVTQVARRQTNVHSPILDGSGTSSRFELGKLRLGGDRLERPLVEGTKDFFFVGINLRHRVHPLAGSPASLCLSLIH